MPPWWPQNGPWWPPVFPPSPDLWPTARHQVRPPRKPPSPCATSFFPCSAPSSGLDVLAITSWSTPPRLMAVPQVEMARWLVARQQAETLRADQVEVSSRAGGRAVVWSCVVQRDRPAARATSATARTRPAATTSVHPVVARARPVVRAANALAGRWSAVDKEARRCALPAAAPVRCVALPRPATGAVAASGTPASPLAPPAPTSAERAPTAAAANAEP